MKVIYIFGNGNTSFEVFQNKYLEVLNKLEYTENLSFIIGDFRGIDTLAMEFLKTKTPNVTIYHKGETPRYMPDKFKTFVVEWQLIGGFKNDSDRDNKAIENCTHFFGLDFNSDENRKSGTLKNIENCLKLNKIQL